MLTGGGRDLAAFEANSARLMAVRGGGTADRTVAAVLRGDAREVDSLLAVLDANQPTRNLGWPRITSMWLGEFDVAERAARSQTRPTNPSAVRRRGHLNLARVLTGRGRWSEAETHLDLMGEIDPVGARRERAHLASLPWLTVPASSLEVCRTELLEWRPENAPPGTPLDRAYEPQRRAYYLGLLHSKLGEPQAALAYADSLEALLDASGIPTVVEGLTATVRADVAWRQGRPPAEILSLLEPVRGDVPAFLWMLDPMVGQEHARLLRVLALHASGREEEARQWLENGFQNTPGWDYYRAPVHHLSAQVLDASGHPEEAAAARAAFDLLWEDADAPIALPAR